MKKLLALFGALGLLTALHPESARAQTVTTVSVCGAQNNPVGYANATLTQDTTGLLCDKGGAGGSGSNAAAYQAGTSPGASGYGSVTAFLSSGGVTTLVSPSNPLPITGSLSIAGNQSNAGAGTTGSTNMPVMGYNYYWNGSAWAQWTGNVGLNAGSNAIGSITNNAFALNAGSNLVGKVGIDQTTPGTTNAVATFGKNQSAAQQQIGVGLNGGQIPAQVAEGPTRTTVTASTSTAGPAASARIGITFQIEAALTANLYICVNGQTCSATTYNYFIPSGATNGTVFADYFSSSGAVSFFTTQSGLVVNSNVATAQ